MTEIFNSSFFENSIISYCLLAGIILLGLILKNFLAKRLAFLLFRSFRKISGDISPEKFLVLLAKPLEFLLLILTFYIAFYQLNFPASWKLVSQDQFGLRMLLLKSFEIIITISVTWILLRIIDFLAFVFDRRSSVGRASSDIQLIPFLKETAKIIICIFSLFFILGAIFDLNIASLIAGLGIGGLAIALAAKETLENLLGSFTIFMDKPFIVGDFVKVGSISGTVEKIGFRSTRLRTVDKTYLTVPNKKMVDAELDNLSLRTQRRVAFTIGLSYLTTAEQLKAIVQDIRKSIDTHPLTNHKDSRVKFSDLGEDSLNIMVLYFIDSVDEDLFLNIREEINFKIMEIVHNHGSQFSSKAISAPK